MRKEVVVIMGYRTVDEAVNFEFQDAEILEIKLDRGHLFLNLGYVTILSENSCNRDIRKMGTNELLFQVQHVTVESFLEEGYKVFDADGNLTGTCDDRVIATEEYPQMFQELQQGNIYALLKKETGEEDSPFLYEIYMDANERTYLLKVKGKHDVQEWERFMNREASY